jgi:hypothetical protein
MGEKYQVDSDESTPNLSLGYKLRKVSDVGATVSGVMMKKRTRRRLSDNGESKRGIPYVHVYFNTGATTVKKRYCLDPFLEDRDIANTTKPEFSAVLSTADVQWNKLPELIGSEIKLKSESGTRAFEMQNPRKARDYSILVETNSSDLYSDKIDNIIPDLIVRHTKNMKIGSGRIVDVSASKYKATVTIELNSGHTFCRDFPLKKRKRDVSFPKRILMSEDDLTNYTFWDFTRDVIGYVPDKSEYDVLLEENLRVQYVSGEWFTGYELDTSGDRVK